MAEKNDIKIISPISIDLGAKNTGVYYAHYKEGAKPNEKGRYEIGQEGKVYIIDDNGYTLLMPNRTASRHQKRGYDRRQMVKRLFKLIWCERLSLPWDSDIQQTISYLLNRRGFSFLTEEYDAGVLRKFPEEAFKELPDALKIEKDEQGNYDFADALAEWAQDKKIIEEKYNAISIKIKELNWNFNINNWKEESAKFLTKEGEPNVKEHFRHLIFAIKTTLDALNSGARYRSKYFDEVKGVLKNNDHTHEYLKQFCGKLQNGNFDKIKVETLSYLIGHLSNLELKPLRKYFNDERHRECDYWDESRLAKLFSHWILREWRVDKKDKLKGESKPQDYQELKRKWNLYIDKNNNGGTVINFWLNTDPVLTIPPYQNNNNRRPPRCQSLILNSAYLDHKDNYPDWGKWLEQLKNNDSIKKHLGIKDDSSDNFEKQIAKLATFSDDMHEPKTHRKDGTLKSETEKNNDRKAANSQRRGVAYLNTRVLQFIFDRTKSDDNLNLNEIYSHAKRYKQNNSTSKEKEEAKIELEKAIANSKLPDELKTKPNYESDGLFAEGTFLHLVCKYYKLRQRARDGRLFIHPEYHYDKKRNCYENTGRFDDKNCLLTYCNHKPKQKRYQLLEDFAALFQLSPRDIENNQRITQQQDPKMYDKLYSWLNSVNGLKSNCEKAAKWQKESGVGLKLEIREILENSTVNKKQYTLCKRAKEISKELIQILYAELLDGESRQKKWEEELNNNHAKGVYLLAQINNIAFKERNGNAKTCRVCSMDNALRMQEISKNKETSAKAQRLPSIATRQFDGGIMRLARIVGGAIANDKWNKIKSELENGKKVCVPIITESNRFEFEPSKEELVGSDRSKNRPRKSKVIKRSEEEEIYQDKKDRIKKAGYNICPYEGGEIKDGEIDHIIPRRSVYGALNDEANLVWASRDGNQHKTNKELRLEDLDTNYKKVVFSDQYGDNDNINNIKKWIEDQLQDFNFNFYRNFHNLSLDEQKAFRHALFLPEGNPLRKKVLDAINNRNRAFVNGTQRYFVEVIANEIYKRAKKEELPKEKVNLLSFDYFGVPSDYRSNRTSTSQVRESYERSKHPIINKSEHKKPKGKEVDKKDGKRQSSYSHLIDAQLAFAIAIKKHCDGGSFKININDDMSEWAHEDGEIHKNLFDAICVPEGECQNGDLTRNTILPNSNSYAHRPIFNSNPRGWHFMFLIEIIENGSSSQYLKGFLHLSKLKACISEKDWLININEQYGIKYIEKEKKQFVQYAKLLDQNEVKNIVTLYGIGNEHYQFGYKGGKNPYPKTVIENEKSGENKFTVKLHRIDKSKVAEFLLSNFSTNSNPKKWKEENEQILNQLKELWHHTKKQKIDNDKKLSFKYSNFKTNGLFNYSLFQGWVVINNGWGNEQARGNDDFNGYLKKHFLENKKTGENKQNGLQHHVKTRKEFSLPQISSGQGFFLVKRESWERGENGKKLSIYQCLSEGNDFSKFARDKQTDKEVLVSQYRRKSIFLFPKSKETVKDWKSKLGSLSNLIDRDEWYEVDVTNSLAGILSKVENKIGADVGRAVFKLTFINDEKLKNNFVAVIKEFRPRSMSKQELEGVKAIGIDEVTAKLEIIKNEIKNLSKKLDNESDNKNISEPYKIVNDLFGKVRENILEIQAEKKFSRKRETSNH